jgi:hypothetical protein
VTLNTNRHGVLGTSAVARPQKSSRRGFLRVLAALAPAVGVAGVPASAAMPASAGVQAPLPLSTVDRRVLDLWRRRAKLLAIVKRIVEQHAVATAALPEWSRPGLKFLMPDGSAAPERDEISHELLFADLSGRLVFPKTGFVRARPNLEEIENEWIFALRWGSAEADAYVRRSIAEYHERRRELDRERERLGILTLNERWDAANDAIGAIEAEIEGHAGRSVLALAALMLRTIDDDQRYGIVVYDNPWLPHAVLKAILPQLAGAIAADVDHALAQKAA